MPLLALGRFCATELGVGFLADAPALDDGSFAGALPAAAPPVFAGAARLLGAPPPTFPAAPLPIFPGAALAFPNPLPPPLPSVSRL